MVAASSCIYSRLMAPSIGLPLLLLAASVAVAGPGDLDPTFGSAGRAFINFPRDVEAGTSIAQQRDGKLLIGRWVYYYSSAEDLSVVRLNADGVLDATFDGDGRTGVDLGQMEGATLAVAQLSNGRIVAVGRVASDENWTATRVGLVRYELNGVVDRSFGTDGVVIESLGVTHVSITALLEQTDGRLVVAGEITAPNGTRNTVVARFNADGALDSTFGASGKLVVDFAGADLNDGAHSLVLQPDGELVVGGYAVDANGLRKLTAVRVTSTGLLDATFGQGGLVSVEVPGAPISTQIALLRQNDGKLVLAGQVEDAAAQECRAVIARLNPDASVDPTFGGAGVINLPLGPCAWPGGSSLAIEPNGSILVANTAGTPYSFPPADAQVVRLTALGEVDDTFGANGTAIVDTGFDGASSFVDPDSGVSMLRQADGRIALVTSDHFDWEGGGDFFVVTRLLASGTSAGLIGLRENYIQLNESAGSARLIARRTGGVAGAVSVDYSFDAGSASSGADFSAANGTLQWADGETGNKEIRISIVDDALSEWSEDIAVTLSNPTGGAHLSTRLGSLVILDNEPPPAMPSPAPGPGPAPGNSGGGGGASGWVLLLGLAMAIFRNAFALTRTSRSPRARLPLHARCSR